MPILKVIFVLSTIVTVTDCCSSRILLLRQHTLQIEEHVVQLVNQLELQQQLKDNGQPPTEPDMLFTDTGQLMQMLPDLDLEGELTSIATTERESASEKWSADEETTIPSSSTTTTSSSLAISSTITMATGEPPPDESTPRLATDVTTIIELIESVPTTTTTTMMTTTSSRKPNKSEEISFKFPCKDNYATDFCLNGGNCYRWANSDSFNYCVCADGFVGERCDSKTEDGVYVPIHPTTVEPQLKTAHVVFSFPMLILLSTVYVVFGAVFMFRNVLAQRRKQQQLHLHKQRFFVSC